MAWSAGDRFRMFWDMAGTPGLGHWYTGRVLGRVERDARDPMRSSPWEALRVIWDPGSEISKVSM